MNKTLILLIVCCAIGLSVFPNAVLANETAIYNESGGNVSISNEYLRAQYDEPRIIYNGDGISDWAWAFGYADILPRDGGEYGHTVHLDVPDDNSFVISEIGIIAQRYGMNGYTRFEIWDDECVIYSNVIEHSEYSSLEWDDWNYIDIPNVIVYDDFYINVCTGSTQRDGVFIALDNDTGICGSYRSYNDELYWDLDEYARCDVNWMICAVESVDEPGYDEGYTDGYDSGIEDAIRNEVIGDVTGDDKVNICDAVLLFNWVSYPNERGITYILR